MSVDLTPEEFAGVCAGIESPAASAPISAVLTSHLEDAKSAVQAYAQHLSAHNQRVGLIEIGANELRLSCMGNGAEAPGSEETASFFEPRHLAEAMEELNADIDRWLVVVNNPKSVEARGILRRISHWVLITGCESEQIVAAYRSLKALSPLARPRLTVALLDAADGEQSERTFQKISGVCEQFLSWPIERGPTIRSSVQANLHTIMHWQVPHDQAAAGPHWQVVEAFVSRARSDEAEISPEEHQEISAYKIPVQAGGQVAPVRNTLTAEAASPHEIPILSLNSSNPSSVLDTVLQHQRGDLIACPVPLPMCEVGRLAVSRDKHLVLLAVAGKGLSDLRSIGYAYRWLTENRQLVAMAMPQLAIDANALPKLRLLVDHADRDAQTLSPILQNHLVEIRPFRTLNWSGRLGLMLEAA